MDPIMAQVFGGHLTPRLIAEILLALFGLETIRLAIAELAANLLEKRTEKWILRRKGRRRHHGTNMHKLFLLRVRKVGNKQHVHAVTHYVPRGTSHV